jgi:hypothetical protein
MAIVAGMLFVLSAIYARFLAPLQERKSKWVFLLLNAWNVVAVGVAFEILEYSTRHGDLAGPLELSAYEFLYLMASVTGAVAVMAIRSALHGGTLRTPNNVQEPAPATD